VWTAASSAAWGQLPEGPGKDLTVQVCGKCHDAEVVSGYHQSSQSRTDTISQMIDQGAKGTEGQFNAIRAYLVKNFGPASPAKTNVNTASAKDLQTQLNLAVYEAEAIVKYRKENGAFKIVDDLKKVPDLDFKTIEAKKDRSAL
jgi:competence ComEA-like helix-hairpin-helix protein